MLLKMNTDKRKTDLWDLERKEMTSKGLFKAIL